MSDYGNDKNIIYFYREDGDYGCFSNWFLASFCYCDRVFSSVEQFVTFSKVMMFRRYDLGKRIMASTDTDEIKKLGSTEFPEFDAEVWDKTCNAIVKRGVRAKFAQNDELLDELLSTGNKTLAEASKRDVKWGIGVAIDDPERYTVSKWTGKNLLGKILMEVRDELRLASHEPDSLYPYPAEDMEFPEWFMSAGELAQNPRFTETVYAYADTLNNIEREAFLEPWSLNDWETAIRAERGTSLPIEGFWEMKQDIFDIVRLGQYMNPAEYKDRNAPTFWEIMQKIAEEEGRDYEAENERLKNDPSAAVPPEVTDRMLNSIRMNSLARRVDFDACYDHMEALREILEKGDFRYADIGRPDIEKIKTLAAIYEVQTYLSNMIARLQDVGIAVNNE